MKKLLLFSALITMAIFAACNKQQVTDEVVPTPDPANALTAGFTIDTQHGTVNEKDVLTITNKTVNADSYEWDFGNGDNSTLANPAYKYEVHGNYTVTLKATDAKGNVQTVSQELVVLCIFGGVHEDN